MLKQLFLTMNKRYLVKDSQKSLLSSKIRKKGDLTKDFLDTVDTAS